MLVSGITVEMVKDYCYRSALKTVTQQRYLYEIRQFIEYCQSRGWITDNPARELQKKTSRRRKRENRVVTEYVSPKEVRRIISVIEVDVREIPRRSERKVIIDVIHFAVYTGLRLGEICDLRWKDVRLYEPLRTSRSGSLQYGWISVRSEKGAEIKTGDEARVPIVRHSYELLLRLRESRGTSNYVFEPPRKLGKLSGWWVSCCFRYYRRLAGIRDEIHFHSLRHTCASWLAEQGVDLKVIQEVLRHSSIRQTMRYAHLIPEVIASKMSEAMDKIRIDVG